MKYKWLIFILSIIFSTPLMSQNIELEKLEAAFIYKFTSFINWKASTHSNFIILVVKNDTIYNELSSIFSDKKINNLNVEILKDDKLTIYEKLNPNIIFLDAKADTAKLDLKKINSSLLISNNNEGLRNPIAINFYVGNDEKLKFEINNENVRKFDIEINSRLLNLSKPLKQ